MPATRSTRRARGFTLIELMMTVAIAAILAAVAIPMYRDYVVRSRIIDATSRLSDFRVRMEQFFMNNRTYESVGGACGVADSRCLVVAERSQDLEGVASTPSCEQPDAALSHGRVRVAREIAQQR